MILNQQVPAGVSTPAMIEKINAVAAGRKGCGFIVDSRHRAEQYRGGMLKLNAHEAARRSLVRRRLPSRQPGPTVRWT